jgi:heme-degrading monooxygenase HmoA
MLKVLDSPEGREKFGFLNLSSYVGTEASTSNEIMTISYWRNIEGIHEFAHSPVHREIWDWWNHTEKEHPYISIMHELYRANGLSGAHENIYINCRPTLLGEYILVYLSIYLRDHGLTNTVKVYPLMP